LNRRADFRDVFLHWYQRIEKVDEGVEVQQRVGGGGYGEDEFEVSPEDEAALLEELTEYNRRQGTGFLFVCHSLPHSLSL